MTDFQPYAIVIADSVSPTGQRLTTIEAALHRFMLSEINTHRALARNSASSRAIPVHKTLRRLETEPAVPLVWSREQKGMQGGAPLDPDTAYLARQTWLSARDQAVEHADLLVMLGVHKSIVNRLLEPFMSHTVIISATDWQNFFDQRCSNANGESLAQPEIAAVADLMRTALYASTPVQVPYGDWHLPYIADDEKRYFPPHVVRKMSVARCARVSYLNHAGVRDVAADLTLYSRLTTARPPHASPLEHVATPLAAGESAPGNFSGWAQLRHLINTSETV